MRSTLKDAYFDDDAGRAGDGRFFSLVRLPNGVQKTTGPNRLDDLNALVLELLPRDRRLELMDVAVSTGITTLEWSQQLRSANIEHRLVAGDSQIAANWLPLPGIGDILSMADDDTIVFAELFGRPVDVTGRDTRSRVALRGCAAATTVARRLRLHRRLELVTPRLRAAPEIEIVEDDIFDRRSELDGRFDAVRAANILNRVYFDEPRLRDAVENLASRLKPQGLLIVCRTHDDGSNHATIASAESNGLVVRARLGSGSEIEDLLAGAGTRQRATAAHSPSWPQRWSG